MGEGDGKRRTERRGNIESEGYRGLFSLFAELAVSICRGLGLKVSTGRRRRGPMSM